MLYHKYQEHINGIRELIALLSPEPLSKRKKRNLEIEGMGCL